MQRSDVPSTTPLVKTKVEVSGFGATVVHEAYIAVLEVGLYIRVVVKKRRVVEEFIDCSPLERGALKELGVPSWLKIAECRRSVSCPSDDSRRPHG